MAKGPLTVTDVMCFHSGGYGFVPYAPCVGRIAYKNRKRIPAFEIDFEVASKTPFSSVKTLRC